MGMHDIGGECSMRAFLSSLAPPSAFRLLARYAEVTPFVVDGAAYSPINTHPDIFIARKGATVFIAPSLPERYSLLLERAGHTVRVGEAHVGTAYPATVPYNAVVTNAYTLCAREHTACVLLNDEGGARRVLDVRQGYARCNTIPLGDCACITSDKGIARVMEHAGIRTLYVTPKGVALPFFPHGFIGGAAGVVGRRVFFIGRLSAHEDGARIRSFCMEEGYEVVDLGNTPLFDGGSIFFF